MLLCVSCGWFEKDQMDYPRTVTFSKEGGEKIIKGGVVSPLCIGKDDDDICSYPEDGYETVRYKWLTARVPLDNYSMIIINAEPNICLFRLSVCHDRGEAGVSYFVCNSILINITTNN